MANNRMYLACRELGVCVLIGKRMALGYYTPERGHLQEFYSYCEDRGLINDPFELVYEDPPDGFDEAGITGRVEGTEAILTLNIYP